MKKRLNSVVADRLKRPSILLKARWIVGMLFIMLIFAAPSTGSANQSTSDLSLLTTSSATIVPTVTATASLTPTQTVTITPSLTASATPTATQTATITTTPTVTETPTITASPTTTPTPQPLTNRPRVLVSTNNVLYVYTQTGELLESYEIPYPIEPRPYSEYARDIIPGPNKTIFVYNGSYDPYLSMLDLISGTWTHTTYNGWSTSTYLKYSGIGRFSKYIYLSDIYTYPDPESGILRFNSHDGSFERYTLETDPDWINLTVGQDNMLYALSGKLGQLHVFDPINMQATHGFILSAPGIIWGIAVNEEGDIFGAASSGFIHHFDNDGLLLNSVELGYPLLDIDISEKSQFVVSADYGHIYILDKNLVIQNHFRLDNYGYSSFVAFLPAQ